MKFGTEIAGTFTCHDGTCGDDIEEMLDAVMDELVDLDDVDDIGIEAVLGEQRFVIEMVIEAASPSDAVAKADTVIRAAFHGAGVATPSWTDHPVEYTSTKSDLVLAAG